MSYNYEGPIPKKSLADFTEQLIEAVVGEHFDIVAWLDYEPNGDEFAIGDRYSITDQTPTNDKYRLVTFVILKGTEIGCFPNLFEGGPRYFIHLILQADQIHAVRDFRGVL